MKILTNITISKRNNANMESKDDLLKRNNIKTRFGKIYCFI